MATPTPVTYNVPSGKVGRGGVAASASPDRSGPVQPVGAFLSVAAVNTAQDIPWSQQDGRPLVVHLHASGGPEAFGIRHTAQVDGPMSFPGFEEFVFNLVPGYVFSAYHVKLKPNDTLWGLPNAGRQSMHCGFLRSDGKYHLISERRYDAMMAWALVNLTKYNLNARVLEGGSMGGWGTISYGVRRYDMFAALYADRPRFRYGFNENELAIADWDIGHRGVTWSQSPLLADEDGGGTFAEYRDMIAYVSNPANKVRWIGWVCGRRDGFALWSEQLAFFDAMRATGRGFAFAWNNGEHDTGPGPNTILQSYPYGTFLLDRGWPVFTEHSLDNDPRIDLVGSYNVGPMFRNVVESAASWSCEVCNFRGASTFKVKPYSDVYKVNAPPKLITTTAANQWQTVTFNAQGA